MAERQEVVIKDVQMSFGSMVVFIIKWTLASIPAVIILLFIFMILGAVLYPLVRGILGIG